MEQDNFTVLENKAIGRNISMYRKIRGMKASDVAERLGMKEASYTRYERGEASITVDIIQQVAEVLKVDPLMMLSVSPSNFIENGSNSPNSIVALHAHNCQTTNEQQTQMMLTLMENIVALNERLMAFLEKGK
jgi:transcriptional regulator with XRE-family HTH domain